MDNKPRKTLTGTIKGKNTDYYFLVSCVSHHTIDLEVRDSSISRNLFNIWHVTYIGIKIIIHRSRR